MTNWRSRLRRFPLRTKVLITMVGAVLVLMGASTHLSFRYWKTQAEAAAEQQALLAAGAGRATVEAALQLGRQEQARRALAQLVLHAPVTGARVYAADGTVLLSHDAREEGRRPPLMWMPAPAEVPLPGVVRTLPDSNVVRAFVPIAVPPAALLELDYELGPVRNAMDRGARLGLLLVIGSVFALAAIVFMMIEREVVAPIERMTGMLSPDAPRGARTDEIVRLHAGVAELIEKGQAAEGRAAEQERRLQQQAGLAQVGEIAAEMAHEFKRPLASIQSAVQLLSQEYVLEERGHQLIEAVDEQLAHLSETMRDLFALAKPAGIETQPVDLRELVHVCLARLAGHPALEGLQLDLDLPSASVVVPGDPKRLEHAVLNLMLNAAEAMSGSGRLTLRLSTGDDIAIIEVCDTGVGIPQAEIDRVLLPFYSTKPAGTGLGLPLVARVVSGHGGALRLSSQPGEGTTARIELPLSGAASTPLHLTPARTG